MPISPSHPPSTDPAPPPLWHETLSGIRARLILLFGGVSLILGILSTVVVEHLAAHKMTVVSGERLREISRSIADTLSQNLVERLREIELMSQSPLLVEGDWNTPAVRTIIEAVKQSYRPYAWMGVADARGRVVVATGGLLEGVDVSQRPWFAGGSAASFLGDVHEAVLLDRHLRPQSEGEPLRFIDFAAPIYDPQGVWRGVVATHAHWTWIEAVIADGLRPEHRAQEIEVFLIGRDGAVLHPFTRAEAVQMPRQLPVSTDTILELDWESGQIYLTAQASILAPRADALEWRVVVRQPVSVALAAVAELRQHLLLMGVVLSLLLVVLADRVAVGFSRPLQQVERVVWRIDHGDETASFPSQSFRIRELDALVGSIRGMTATLIERKRALEDLNQSLEAQVQERTTQLSSANQRLAALATTDGLTGVANRRHFDETLAQEWERAQRAGTALALMLLDIDYFKRYNDHYGHQAGDDCLRRVAQVLRDSVHRATDLVARYGGEEFVVVLPDTPVAGAGVLAEAMCQAVSALAIPHAASPLGRVTVSLGVAGKIPLLNHDAGMLIKCADQALYQAKAAGRHQVAVAGNG
ncbi:diguanylate cyclase [Thiobaca trueperi]|uniref:diguanylate cyclase n=1 Tax=Thiobaca trueperi TaxID=127458 RepID=A0A4R3N9P5_9GAMM|nr:diguanylate cyclase [Thiobaca trueperi]TCT23709.1 diguanylate cyclase [Thiobaca trueperi]